MPYNLVNTSEYLKNLLELSGLGTFHADLHGDNLFVNGEWEKIYGISGTAALGKGWIGLLVEEDVPSIKSMMKNACTASHQPIQFMYRIQHPDNGIRHLKGTVRRVCDKNEDYFLGYVQDITAIKLVEQQLQLSNEKLAASNCDKDRMMRVLAHDLKNPIEGICSLTSLMLDDPAHPKETVELLRLVHDSCSYSVGMIKDLIEATLNNHAETMRKKEVDLSLILRQCVLLLKHKAEEKDQEIICDLTEKIEIKLDPEKISRLMCNLISNAIKFSPLGASIVVRTETKAKFTRISVLDNGIGIPDELKERVFDMFTDAKRFGTASEAPFGLGLSICKQIVGAHHGKIWFESVPDKGTSFYVDLPHYTASSHDN